MLSPVGDADRLQQVFWNLLDNAVKFTAAGGAVEIHLEEMEATAVVSIRDTGEGIAPAFLPHVFERFAQQDSSTTRRHSGLGLGLAIVRELVERHAGTVEAESAGVGLGATFIVTLRVIRPEGVVVQSAFPLHSLQTESTQEGGALARPD